MSDLRDDLTEIRGIGGAKADEIMQVLESHDTQSLPDEIESAYEYAKDGNARMAASYLGEVLE